MNLKSNHSAEKQVSAVQLFRGEGVVTALQILQNQQLHRHLTKVPALLICIVGEVVFENEKGIKETLRSGEYVTIEPLVMHWIIGRIDSQLLLLK